MPTKKVIKKKAVAKTLADFRAVHDKSFVVPAKIKAGIEKLGKDGWEYEVEFLKICGLSTTDFARYRDQFPGFFVLIGGERYGKRVWAGSKATADKMREMV